LVVVTDARHAPQPDDERRTTRPNNTPEPAQASAERHGGARVRVGLLRVSVGRFHRLGRLRLWSGSPAMTTRRTLHTSTSTTAVARYRPLLSDVERMTLLGFLPGLPRLHPRRLRLGSAPVQCLVLATQPSAVRRPPPARTAGSGQPRTATGGRPHGSRHHRAFDQVNGSSSRKRLDGSTATTSTRSARSSCPTRTAVHTICPGAITMTKASSTPMPGTREPAPTIPPAASRGTGRRVVHSRTSDRRSHQQNRMTAVRAVAAAPNGISLLASHRLAPNMD
jgi:hypothetical protein